MKENISNQARSPRLIYTARDAFMDGVPTECGEGELKWRFHEPKPQRASGFNPNSLLPK